MKKLMVDDAFKAEREKTRALRKSRWWQTKLSRGILTLWEITERDDLQDHVPVCRGRSIKGNVASCLLTDKRPLQLGPCWSQAAIHNVGVSAVDDEVIPSSGYDRT